MRKGVILMFVAMLLTVSACKQDTPLNSSSIPMPSLSVPDAPPASAPAEQSQPQTSSVPSQATTADGYENKLDDGVWNLKLVNKQNPMDEGYSITTATVDSSQKQVDARIVEPLNAMLRDAKKAGFDLIIVSGYRSYDYQVGLVERNIQALISSGMSEQEATVETYRNIAVPGTSEHNLGLAADIACAGHTDLTERFAQTAQYQWLKQNCAKYGFIERYPKNKEEITGIVYEPWHYRYVGVEHAQKIAAAGQCLEEYLGYSAVGF